MSESKLEQAAKRVFHETVNAPAAEGCFSRKCIWDNATGERVPNQVKAEFNAHLQTCKRCQYLALGDKTSVGDWQEQVRVLKNIEADLIIEGADNT
jgi:hypothetical protein